MLYHLILIISGLLVSRLLFFRFPRLEPTEEAPAPRRLSVIIPARDEARTLPLLLDDLARQDVPIHEIIGVDDHSSDGTAAVIRSAGVVYQAAGERPPGWIGKSWACQTGAEAAGGDVLLFLDADVRLSPGAIGSLMREKERCSFTVSIQPFHQTVKGYEQLSLFFNLIQLAANAISPAFRFRHTGLSGPVIAIDRAVYQAIGGHRAVRSSIVDDLALGRRLQAAGYPFRVQMGGSLIRYRMYSGGLRDLWQGWTKNMATGAGRTPIWLLIQVFIWITACTAVPIALVQAFSRGGAGYQFAAVVLYGLWALELARIARKAGRFKGLAIALFPLSLIFFLVVFAVSLFKRLFHRAVIWKGRKIKLGQ